MTDFRINIKPTVDRSDVAAFANEMRRAANETVRALGSAAAGAQAKFGAGSPGAIATRGLADIEGQLRGQVGISSAAGKITPAQQQLLSGAIDQIVRDMREAVRKSVAAAGRNMTSDLGESAGARYRSRVGRAEQETYQRHDAEREAALFEAEARKQAEAERESTAAKKRKARADKKLADAAERARPTYGPPEPPKSGVAPGVAAAERKARADKKLADDAEKHAARQRAAWQKEDRANDKAANAHVDAVLKRMGLLPPGALEYYKEQMGSGGRGLGNARAGAGPLSALDRYYGLQTGIGHNEFANDTVLPGDTKTLAEMSAEARANLTSLERMRLATEELAKAEQYLADLMGLSGRDMYGKLRAAAGPTRQAELLAAEARLEGTAPLVDLEGRWSALQARRAAEIRGAKVSATSDDDIDVLGQTAAAQGGLTAAIKTRAMDERRSNAALLRAEADRIVATNTAASAAKRMAADTMRAMGVGREAEATPTQRLQAWIANRAGGDNLPRPATDFMRGKQLIGSRIMTTASFAASGGLLYGALNLGGDILRESTELQVELGIIESQIEALEGTANSVSLEHLREEIHKTSLTAGVEANEVANVTRQLAGAFADPDTGNANFVLAQREADIALRYSKISPLSQQEITDSLSATSLAFRDVDTDVPLGFERILDTVTTLENRFGVLGPEIVKFTADLAPLGKELGFTQEQLSGLGAVAQSRSGRSGTVLSEQLGRILPALQDQQEKLYELFSLNSSTEGAVDDLMKGFTEGNTPEVLRVLVENYRNLTKDQQNALASIVGSRREAATFYALLDSPSLTADVLEGGFVEDGEFEKRWDNYEQTVTMSTQRMRRAVEEFGQKLFDAGIDDLLVKGAQFGTMIASSLSVAVDLMTKLNDLTGGHLTTVLLAVGAWRTLGPYVIKATAAMKGSAAFGGLVGRSGRLGAAPVPTMVGAGAVGFTSYADISKPKPPSQSLGSRIRGSAIIGQLSTAIAGYALLELGAEIDAAKQQIQKGREDLRARIVEALDRGVTEEKLRETIEAVPQRDTALFTTWTGLGGVQSGIKLPNIRNIFGAITGTNSDARASGLDELEKELTARAAAQEVAQGQALIDAFNEAFSQTSSGSNMWEFQERWQGLGERISRYQYQLPAEARAALSTSGLDAVGIDDGFTIENLRELVNRRQQDPSNVLYQQLMQFVINQAGKDVEMMNLIALAVMEMTAKNATDDASADLESKEGEAKAAFDTAMGALQAANEAGRISTESIMEKIAERRTFLEVQRAAALALGNEALAQSYEQQIYELEVLGTQIFTSDSEKGFDIRSRMLGLSGITGRLNTGTAVDQARAAYEEISAAQGITAETRAEYAMNLLEAQQEELDRQINEATDPAERDRLLAQKISVSSEIRTDLIRGQLQRGAPAEVRDAIAKVFGIKTEEAEAIITNALIETDQINQSMLVATLEARRNLLQKVLDRLRAFTGKGFLSRLMFAPLASKISQIEDAIAGLGDLDSSVADLATIGAGGGGGSGGKSGKAEDPNAIADAYGALLSAQLARDPVAQAQQNLANANAAVARADTEAGRLQALAQQVSAQHALEDAMQAMWESQIDVANAMSESVGDVVAVANRNAAVAQERLRVALANGTGGAELFSLQAAAIRAQTEAVETARSDRIGDLEYLYEFDKITAEQFIKSLQAELLLIPEANKEARREIERRIKALRDEMSSNMSMNIPSEITLPTLYEARRLNQNRGSGGPAWGTYSQLQSIDNRVVTINVYESGNVQRTTDAVAKAMDSSPRSGSLPTGEWV